MGLVDYGTGMAFIESFMTTTCAVKRDTLQVDDDILDVETMELIRKENDENVIYSGKCIVKRPRADTQKPVIEGGQELSLTAFRVLFPISFTDIRLGDMIYIVDANDPSLDGRRLRVMNVDAGTHSVYRGAFAQDISTTLDYEG